MKKYSLVLLLSLALIMMVISGCIQPKKDAATLPSETPFLTASNTASVPSFTPQPTNLSTPASTPTIAPTLPVEQARVRLLELLASNGDCRLPCLWGITIGKSSFQDVRTILMPLSSLSYSVYLDSPELGGIIPRYTDGELEIYTAAGFIVSPDNNIVNHLTFNAEAHKPLAQGGYENVFDSKFFGEKVSAYSLPHVLTEQGVPTSVMIETAGGPLTRGGTGGFEIMLLYPDRGILVNYTTQMHLIGDKVRGCPSNAHVEMELYPPGQSNSFFESLKQTDWALKMTGYRSLEETTSTTMQEFYDAFHDSTDKCIETLAKLWPMPEP